MILIVIQICSKLRAIIDHLGAILTKLDGKTYICRIAWMLVWQSMTIFQGSKIGCMLAFS